MKKVTAEMVKELRDRTGVSMSKCKEALDHVEADMEKAIDFLRKAGIASAVKKEGREANEGVIGFAETDAKVAVMEVNSETDFVAQNSSFKQFVQALCLEACLTGASSVEELMSKPYSKDPSVTVDQYRALTMQSLGENIQVKRLALMSKKAGVSFGLYSHMGGKIVAVVALEGAAGQESLAREVAMHVAAEAPDYLRVQDIPEDVKEREKDVARAQVQGKPANVADKIVEGKLDAFYKQVCLLEQKFIKDASVSVAEVIGAESKKIGHTLSVQSFLRWKVGS
ncbi:MAG: elongation factor Ts [Chlamydiae bacterium]|nr:elongation factor Ts [Chlamydiota bacterium]